MEHANTATRGDLPAAAMALVLGIVGTGSGSDLPLRKVHPFPMDHVSLAPGPFLDAQNRTFANLKALVDADRMLYTFRRTANLDVKGAAPVGGWEDPACPVRGSYPGHVLSALSQGFAATGDAELKSKLDYMVAEFAKVQAASKSAGYGAGYLSAFPERLVDSLIVQRWGWAPLYAIHKVLAGLIDANRLADNAQALEVAKSLGLWYHEKFKPYTQAQRNAFWNVPVAGEYGGSGESLANLYMITLDPRFLEAAKYFDKEDLFGPLRQNSDKLSNLHANTHIPQVAGALRIYEATGDGSYRDIAPNFFRIVTAGHLYPNGGVGWKEDFHPPYQIYERLDSDKGDWPATAETCCAYNLLKLARSLFFLDPDPAILDYYEHALYNQILASQDPDDPYGHATYYQPMRPGSIKTYGTSAVKLYSTTEQDNTAYKCCCGTGLENATKFGESIFFQAGDTLYVNLFIPSTLRWKAKGATVVLETKYPASDTVRLTLEGARKLPLKLRAPRWLRQSMQVKVDGVVQDLAPRPGSMFVLDKSWSDGSTVELVMPQSLRFEADPDSAQIASVFYGNTLLAGLYGQETIRTTPGLDARSVKPTGNVLEFAGTASTGKVVLKPYYLTHHQRYSPYWRLRNGPRDLQDPQDGIREAERAAIAHANRIYGQASAHSSGHVGGIDFDDSRVRFDIARSSTARCTVVVYFANGSGGKSTHKVSTGFWDTVASYKPTAGWGRFDSTRLVVPFVAGDNALTFAKGDGFAELDAIRLIEPAMNELYPVTLEAEDGVVKDANIYSIKGFSNGALVGGMDFATSTVVFPAFEVPDSGIYKVRVLYSNGSTDTSCHRVRVGNDSVLVKYKQTGGWGNPDSADLVLSLPRSSAMLEFRKLDGFAQLDAIRILGRESSSGVRPRRRNALPVHLSARGGELVAQGGLDLLGARLEVRDLAGHWLCESEFVRSSEGAQAVSRMSGKADGLRVWRVRRRNQDIQAGTWFGKE